MKKLIPCLKYTCNFSMGQKGSLDENAVHLVVTVLSSPELTLLPTILPHSFLQRYLRVSLMPNARNIKDGKHHVT